MNQFELIEKYLPAAVDEYFVHDAKSAVLEKGKKFIDVDFKETGYVKIADILMDGLSDYYQTQQNSFDLVNPDQARPSDPANYAAYAGNMGSGERDGFRIGGTDVKWEILRLQWVRGRQFRIDYIANEETAGIIIGNALEHFHKYKVIPEVDVARFSYIASQAAVSLGNLKTETVDDDEIIELFNSVFEWMFEMGVPEEQQVLFVNPSVMTKIRNTKELVKFITQGDFRSEAGITFNVEKYMNRPIIEVPSDRFFTDVKLTQNGYAPTSTSKVINFMCVSTMATVPVRKLEYEKIYGPELSGLAGFHGYLINYLLYHGIFIPKNKLPGVYVSLSNVDASTKTSLLRVKAIHNATTHAWSVTNFFTNPSGLRGSLVYSSSAITLGSTPTVGPTETVKPLAIGQTVSGSEANEKYYFGLVDASGTVIATSAQTTVN